MLDRGIGIGKIEAGIVEMARVDASPKARLVRKTAEKFLEKGEIGPQLVFPAGHRLDAKRDAFWHPLQKKANALDERFETFRLIPAFVAPGMENNGGSPKISRAADLL